MDVDSDSSTAPGFHFFPPVLHRSRSIPVDGRKFMPKPEWGSPSTLPRPGMFSLSGRRSDGAQARERTTIPESECQEVFCTKNALSQISAATVASLLRSGKCAASSRLVLIVDCRFNYEFDGGHIQNAINISNAEDLERLLLAQPLLSPQPMLIFHCEYSQLRGPTMCQHLRKRDRELNQYPHLFYPELFVLDGGYRQFFQSFPELCSPANYISMDDPAFATAREEGMRIFRSMKSLKRSWSTSAIGLLQKRRLALDGPASPTGHYPPSKCGPDT